MFQHFSDVPEVGYNDKKLIKGYGKRQRSSFAIILSAAVFVGLPIEARIGSKRE
ncbi:hypothetical protein [Candidatus Endomicrobiellum trichonymphae]|uniref:hypothetical protein n=1 Tax=Endomicrobium trichonymphae TaxID=1408204 RepID=UPI000322DA87|nr:hypothetical protein [Candidatus Endomicrobium trichonymphae]